MYKIIILTTLFVSNNLYAMDNMHDHNSKQNDHTSHLFQYLTNELVKKIILKMNFK